MRNPTALLWMGILLLMSFAGLNRVHAIQMPEGCWEEKKFPCALDIQKPSEHPKGFPLRARGKLLFHGPDEISLIEGEMATLEKNPLRLRHGEFSLFFEGEAFVERKQKKIQWSMLSGTSEINALPVKEARGRSVASLKEVVRAGLGQWIGSLDPATGELYRGVAAPYDFKRHSRAWMQLAGTSDKKTIREKLGEFRAHWKDSMERVSHAYAVEVSRQQAQERAETIKSEQLSEAQRKESRELLDLYRRKTLGP